MYTYKSRIRYSELDETGHLKLEALLDYFQDCSTFHSEDIGIGVDYLKEHHMVWVMSSWQIIVEDYPKLCDVVTIGTSPYEFRGFVGFRNFVMMNEEGRYLAYANTIWSLLDTDTNHPVKPSQRMLESYVLEPKLEMDYAPRRIQLPGQMEKREPVQIRNHHLDTNHHVNNGQFVRIAIDSLEERSVIRQLRAEYKKQVMLGDILIPYTAQTQDGKRLAALKDEDGNTCCVVELLGESRGEDRD